MPGRGALVPARCPRYPDAVTRMGWPWLLVLVRAALHSETEAECDCLLRCAQLLTTEEAAVVALPLELL